MAPCQNAGMDHANRQAVEALYREAVVLGDRARAWFDGPGAGWRAGLPVDAQAQVATESLAVTSRLMAAMAWLLDPVHAADGLPLPPFAAESADIAPPASLAGTPGGDIIVASRRLCARIAALTGDFA